MPVSRVLVSPDPSPLQVAPDRLGLSFAEPAAAEPIDAILAAGSVGPVRAARWNPQLPVSAGVVADAPAAIPNADATSS